MKNSGFPSASTEYYQVFSQKFGFAPNLSILDLLFNEGTEAMAVVRAGVRNIFAASGAVSE
jgi:hypothetical protein